MRKYRNGKASGEPRRDWKYSPEYLAYRQSRGGESLKVSQCDIDSDGYRDSIVSKWRNPAANKVEHCDESSPSPSPEPAAPTAGPTGTSATQAVVAPTAGPTGTSATQAVVAPTTGPTGLQATAVAGSSSYPNGVWWQPTQTYYYFFPYTNQADPWTVDVGTGVGNFMAMLKTDPYNDRSASLAGGSYNPAVTFDSALWEEHPTNAIIFRNTQPIKHNDLPMDVTLTLGGESMVVTIEAQYAAGVTPPVDLDGDGVWSDVDIDDNDPSVGQYLYEDPVWRTVDNDYPNGPIHADHISGEWYVYVGDAGTLGFTTQPRTWFNIDDYVTNPLAISHYTHGPDPTPMYAETYVDGRLFRKKSGVIMGGPGFASLQNKEITAHGHNGTAVTKTFNLLGGTPSPPPS